MWACQKSSTSSMNKEFWRLLLCEFPASVAALRSNHRPLTIKETNCKRGSCSAPATMGNVSSWSLNADTQQAVVCPSLFFFFFDGEFKALFYCKRGFIVRLAHKGKQVLLVYGHAQTDY